MDALRRKKMSRLASFANGPQSANSSRRLRTVGATITPRISTVAMMKARLRGALSRTRSGRCPNGSAGVGSATHLGCVLFNSAVRVDIPHVPCRVE